MPLGPGFGRSSGGTSTGGGAGDVTAAGDNDFTGVNSFEGSFIFPLDTVTLTANAGTIDITQGRSVVTNGANTVLTPSAAGQAEQQVWLKFVNTDTAAHTVTGAGTASTISFTAAASSTTYVIWISSGAAWSVLGGAVTINDISAITPVLADSVAFWDASAGIVGRSTFTTLQGILVAARLGSHTTPDTTGGAITWTAPVLEVFANTATAYALPAAAGYDGKGVIFYNTGTNVITIDPNGSEVIVRAGTVQTGGVSVTLAGVAGNYLALICDGVRWCTLGSSGTVAVGS